ncbi:MAG: Photosynthesis system assembly factor [Miltoncostaeaceae bacterium]|nr:Photosynthesis system assembly factor [Miltoncostaeaceae bacterium]
MAAAHRDATRTGARRAWRARALLGGLVSVLAMALPQVAMAGIWTPLSSGTNDTISAIDYQADDRFWYATTNGRLAYRQGGVFLPGTGPGAGVIFNDIAFQPAPGLVGIAVGNSDNVWRTADGGATWTKLVMPPTINNDDCQGDADVGNSTWDNGYSVSWGDPTTVYVTGDRGNIMKSVDAGATFAEVNKKPTDDDGSACRVNETVTTDSVFLSATLGYFISQSFGQVSFTDSGLTTNAAPRDEAVNNFDQVPRLALDRGNPNRSWAVDRCRSCLYDSVDGAITYQGLPAGQIDILNGPNEPYATPQDVAFAGGTVLTAGGGGQILTSIDGLNFFYQKADSPLATADWKAVDLADASHGAVGGANGALAATTAGNTIPDIVAPTGTITGPETVVTGVPATFTASVVDNPGGSGIDPNGFAWSAPGIPGATGAAPTIAFPGQGTFTLKVTFRDLAGNPGVAEKTINVRPKERSVLTATARPRRDARAPFKFVVTGRVKPPAGVARTEVCKNKVTVATRAGGRLIVKQKVAVKPNCTFKAVVKIRNRAKIRNAAALFITISKPGASLSTRPASAIRLAVLVR